MYGFPVIVSFSKIGENNRSGIVGRLELCDIANNAWIILLLQIFISTSLVGN